MSGSGGGHDRGDLGVSEGPGGALMSTPEAANAMELIMELNRHSTCKITAWSKQLHGQRNPDRLYYELSSDS